MSEQDFIDEFTKGSELIPIKKRIETFNILVHKFIVLESDTENFNILINYHAGSSWCHAVITNKNFGSEVTKISMDLYKKLASIYIRTPYKK